MKGLVSLLLVFSLGFNCLGYKSPKEFTINVVTGSPPSAVDENTTPQQLFDVTISASFKFAFDLLRNNTCSFLPQVLQNIDVKMNELYTYSSSNIAIKHMIDLSEIGESLAIGFTDDAIAVPAAQTSKVYDIAMISSNGGSPKLDNSRIFPFYTRMTLSTRQQVQTLHDQLVIFYEDYGIGWGDIAVISSIDEQGIEYANVFIDVVRKAGILNLVAYQQVLVNQNDVSLELDELADSGARVIVTSISDNIVNVLEQAHAKGLVSEHHVWTSSRVLRSIYPSPLLQGLLIVNQNYEQIDQGEECYRDALANADPNVYFGAGGPPPYGFIFDDPMDTVLTAMIAADSLDKQELLTGYIPAQLWSEAIRNVSYDSINTHVQFTPDGNRVVGIVIAYGDAERFARGGQLLENYVNIEGGEFSKIRDIVWYSNTTEIPDLDVRPPIDYWSCDKGEKGRDETGKKISLQTPDGSDVDDIDIDYHCDYFIDCKNLSDESKDCTTNYTALYIVFAIITFLLMFIVLLLILFVCVFGLCLKYQRVRVASPPFLIILLISILVGYSSIFAFYGKPHPVACAFQPWLLGLPVISMIAVLGVKNFRLYRIFRFPFKRTKMSNFEVFILWGLAMAPALVIVILWTIISTPTAEIRERDGADHFICATGGFTGEPGGIVFFSIFVAYSGIILLTGAVISILARNIPSLFNETKLLTISIYNLGFLAAVIIPVFFVVQPFNPFIAWILRTSAVLYAFTATLLLQFAPMVFRIVVIDRFKNRKERMVVTVKTTDSESLGSK